MPAGESGKKVGCSILILLLAVMVTALAIRNLANGFLLKGYLGMLLGPFGAWLSFFLMLLAVAEIVYLARLWYQTMDAATLLLAGLCLGHAPFAFEPWPPQDAFGLWYRNIMFFGGLVAVPWTRYWVPWLRMVVLKMRKE